MADPVTVDEGDVLTVTDVGLLAQFPAVTSRLFLKAQDANVETVGYSFNAAILDGSPLADSAAIVAAGLHLLPGEGRLRNNMSVQKVWLRAPANKTCLVRIETI